MKQASNEPETRKARLLPLEGGVEELERYYRSMARVIYCLFPPMTVGAIFGSGEVLFLVLACMLPIQVPYMFLGMIIMYSSSTSNSDKAKLWWDLAWHARSRMLACFACGLLAYVLLRLWSQTQLEELLLSEHFWQSVSMCALWMIYFATAVGGFGVQHSNALMFQEGMPTSWGHKLTLFYILGQLSLFWTFHFSLAGLLLLPLFALVVWQYLRYRADGSGQRLGSIYFMLQMALIMAALIIMARATVDIYLKVVVMGESIVPHPFPVEELVLWWLAPTALLLLLSLALPYVQRRLLQLGMFPTMPPPPGHDDTKALRKYHKRLKLPLELSQQQPILRRSWHLAWIRMVIWLGARAWLVGLLSVAVGVEQVWRHW